MSVLRFDTGSVRKVTRTPQGGIRVEAVLSGPRVLEYTQPDGSVRREYRPASVMFNADALATIEGAPVTDRHPAEKLVTSENFDRLVRGHASKPRQDGDSLVADLTIQSKSLIDKLETQREISLGYFAEVDDTPGVTPTGERYDAIHTAYQVNHVAVVSKARSKGAKLRIDADGNEHPEECARINAMDIEAVKAERDKAIARAGELEKERDQIKARFDDAEDKLKALPATARRIASLLVTAGKHGVEVKADASESDIRDAILCKVCPDLKLDEKSEDYKQARLDAALEAPAPKKDAAAFRLDDAPKNEPVPADPPWVTKSRENDKLARESTSTLVIP